MSLRKPLHSVAPVLFVFAASLAAAPPQARIKIDVDRTIGEVHPHIFGNFAEHLGRVIYGGIYEENSPLADENGYRKDVLKAVQDLGVSILRYPGGNFVSGYNWKDGIGPKDQRPVRADYAWGGVESNRFGTDEFLRYCEKVKTEPYICINAGLGTVEEARQWVEYCNETRHTYWADLRRKNGRDQPYGVKVWGLGNEIDGPWQIGHKNAEDYVKFAMEAGKAMRWADPSIKLIASGSSNFRQGSDWIGWNRTVLSGLNGLADYISLHTYIGNPDNNLERFLGESQQDMDHRISVVRGLIEATQSGQASPRTIYIAYDEWNVWYRARGPQDRTHGLEEIYNFEDALAMGMFFNSFFRNADIVKMANLAQLVNGIAPIFTNKEGLFLQPIYYPIAEYGKQRGNTALNPLVTAPTYALANRPPVQALDVSSTFDAKGKFVYVNVLNRSEKMDIESSIENQTGPLDGTAEVWQMNHPDLKATHTFGDMKVKPVTSKVPIALSGNSFTYRFPAHSLTILKLHLK